MDESNIMKLDPNMIYRMPIKDGFLEINMSCDPNYPGLDIEFIPNDESETEAYTRPRILIEAPYDKETGAYEPLRAYAWTDAGNEDYTHKIDFENENGGKSLCQIVVKTNDFDRDEVLTVINATLKELNIKYTFDNTDGFDKYTVTARDANAALITMRRWGTDAKII
jgi:hypothetical protein